MCSWEHCCVQVAADDKVAYMNIFDKEKKFEQINP